MLACPMGRKSLEEERTRQCLDAFELAIVELGYAGASLDAVASRAGLHRTIIRHYFGGRDGLVTALLERLRERYADRYHAKDSSSPPATRLKVALDAMFKSYAAGAPTMDRVFDALYAAGTRDEAVVAFMRRFYRDSSHRLAALIRLVYPLASESDVIATTEGVLGLAVGHSFLDTVEPARARAKKRRASAEILLSALR